MNIDMIASADDTNSMTISGMSPVEFDRLRMIILQEWESDDPLIGEKLAVTDANFIKTPFENYLSSFTWGPWMDWNGLREFPKEEFQQVEFEVLVQVERRGPDAELWLVTEAHKMDWAHTGGKEDIVRFRISQGLTA